MRIYCLNHDTNYFERGLTQVVALEQKSAQLHGRPSSAEPTTAALELAELDPGNPAAAAIIRKRAAATSTQAHVKVGKKVSMILYKPTDALAVIDNRTVGAGDTIDGFKVVDIERDSVTIQSASGRKTALHLGDVIK